VASTTIAQAVTDLYTLLNTSISGVTKVYDHEPTTPVDNSVTVTCQAVTPDFFVLSLRIYVKVGDARDSQQRLWTLIQNVDATVDAQFGPSRWDITYDPEAQVFIATNLLETGREDSY